jgi:16S rRNA (cytidine1402-2'-O)-methyltransferase
VVCRELSKTHEEIVRGTLAELAAWATPPAAEKQDRTSGAVRGEITLVVAGLDRRSRRRVRDPGGTGGPPGLPAPG